MSWRDTLTSAQARLTALEAAETDLLLGKAVSEVRYDGELVRYAQGATLAEVQRAIQETRLVIQQLSGARRTGGAIIPIFGR